MAVSLPQPCNLNYNLLIRRIIIVELRSGEKLFLIIGTKDEHLCAKISGSLMKSGIKRRFFFEGGVNYNFKRDYDDFTICSASRV